MKENVLIVEDEFIVANDLRLKLLKAGYTVCGIAATVNEAKELIEQTKPTWVLLDIFLQDGSMGTDLATYLRGKNIGFIYISANTNQSVLEKAKATQPYAFIVKPFRERDLLIMLDIASQKHQANLQLNIQKELVWKGKLQNIIDAPVDIEAKIERIPAAFRTFVPFDYMKIDLLSKRENGTIQFSFVRTGFDEYEIFRGVEIQSAMGLNSQEKSRFRLRFPEKKTDEFLNGIEYKKSLMEDLWEKQLSNFYSLGSRMLKRVVLPNFETIYITFYSKDEATYSSDQLNLLEKTENELAQLFAQLKEPEVGLKPSGGAHKTATKEFPRESIEEGNFDGIIGNSPGLLRVLDKINIVAGSTTSVLITGESGTGKERVAQCLHKLSKRKLKPLVVVNCAALPFDLVESELFGHEKGAFTGALERRLGKFETADGGTIFLDEIGELPLEAQVKLLRVTQEMEFERVGSSKTTKVDVRIIAATNKNLEKEVSEGRFRLDLYYRLNVFPIELPPLRDRKQDIQLLAESFIERYAQRMGRQVQGMSREVIDALNDYSWPGNVRELEHVIERSVLTNLGEIITEINMNNKLWKAEESNSTTRKKTLEENEADHIISVLKSCHGKVGGPGGAAEILGLPVSTLHTKMKKLGIKKGFD